MSKVNLSYDPNSLGCVHDTIDPDYHGQVTYHRVRAWVSPGVYSPNARAFICNVSYRTNTDEDWGQTKLQESIPLTWGLEDGNETELFDGIDKFVNVFFTDKTGFVHLCCKPVPYYTWDLFDAPGDYLFTIAVVSDGGVTKCDVLWTKT